ncbi:hypothetical protein GCM10009753_72110 [Streptantibioticus ferralitis]
MRVWREGRGERDDGLPALGVVRPGPPRVVPLLGERGIQPPLGDQAQGETGGDGPSGRGRMRGLIANQRGQGLGGRYRVPGDGAAAHSAPVEQDQFELCRLYTDRGR